MNILLDYFFPITTIEPTPEASTSFLKQVCLVVKKKSGGVDGVITECDTMTEVAAVTDNLEAQQLFNAGMSKVFILTAADLDIAEILVGHESDFFTLLISSDFSDANVTAADFGAFTGVIGVSSADDAFLATQAAIANRSAFHTTVTNDAKNMCYAFGKLLSNLSAWRNQQYITMPLADDVDTLGDANSLFDDKISFVINDDEYGKRLALFAVGGKAIVAPYIKKNLEIDFQSAALTFISGSQPGYTVKNAALLEDELQKVIQEYIDAEDIEAGTVEVSLVNDNFTVNGEIDISEPKAMWRIFANMGQTL